MTFLKRSIPFLICISHLAGCVGPSVPTYRTKSQNFSWGETEVWMSNAKGTPRDAMTGRGYLLVDMHYKKSYLNRNCTITLNNVSIAESEGGVILLDQTLLPTKHSSLMRERKIGEYGTGQFHLSGLNFDFDRNALPYVVKLNMSLNCPDEKTEHSFSKKIRFRMEHAMIWEL